jgi:hypothetical protein
MLPPSKRNFKREISLRRCILRSLLNSFGTCFRDGDNHRSRGSVEYDWPIRLFAPISNRFESCDPKLPPFTNLSSKLIVTALFGRFKKVIPRYRTEGVSIQSHLQLNVRLDSHMVLQQLLFQMTWERKNKIWCQYMSTGIETFQSIQLTVFSWRQIFKSSLLYICISTRIFQLMWNICDCFFHCAAWVIIQALLVWRFYNRVYGWFPPHFTLVINLLKLQFDQSLFNYIISYPTTNPTHPPWLITKPSWFIRSTSCGYEPKITLTSSSKQS